MSLHRHSMIFLTFVVLTANFSLAIAAPTKNKDPKLNELIEKISVESLKINKKEIQATVKFPAKVHPIVYGKLRSEISGYVTRVHKNLGQSVKAGDRIYSIKNNDVGLRFNEYTVRSPVSGIVSQLDLSVGQYIEKGAVSGSVLNPKTMKLIVQVPAEDLPAMEIGLKAEMSLGQENIPAKVAGVSPLVNPKTGTALVEIRPTATSEKLIPGAIGRITIFLKPQEQFSVPPRSVISLGSKYFLRKIDEKDKIKFVEVQLGRLVEGEQVILSGLMDKDEIVVQSSDHLRNGDTIQRMEKKEKEEKTL